MKTLTWRIVPSDPSGARYKLDADYAPVAVRVVMDRAVGKATTFDILDDGVSIFDSLKLVVLEKNEEGEGDFAASLAFLAEDSIITLKVTDAGDGVPATVELDLE